MATLGARAKSARRAAQRRITELNYQLESASTQDVQTSISRRITRMEELIKQTRLYEGGKRIIGRTVEQRESATSELEALNRETRISRNTGVRASNRVFKENINAVSRGSKIDEMSENQMRAFWRATQHSWEGRTKLSTKERYGLIQDYYGTTNLKDIYDAAMAINADKIELLDVLQEDTALTQEQKELAQSLMREDDEMVKRYSKNEDSPIIGAVRSSIPEMSKSDFKIVIGAIRDRRSGKISDDEYQKIIETVRNS